MPGAVAGRAVGKHHRHFNKDANDGSERCAPRRYRMLDFLANSSGRKPAPHLE